MKIPKKKLLQRLTVCSIVLFVLFVVDFRIVQKMSKNPVLEVLVDD